MRMRSGNAGATSHERDQICRDFASGFCEPTRDESPWNDSGNFSDQRTSSSPREGLARKRAPPLSPLHLVENVDPGHDRELSGDMLLSPVPLGSKPWDSFPDFPTLGVWHLIPLPGLLPPECRSPIFPRDSAHV